MHAANMVEQGRHAVDAVIAQGSGEPRFNGFRTVSWSFVPEYFVKRCSRDDQWYARDNSDNVMYFDISRTAQSPFMASITVCQRPSASPMIGDAQRNDSMLPPPKRGHRLRSAKFPMCGRFDRARTGAVHHLIFACAYTPLFWVYVPSPLTVSSFDEIIRRGSVRHSSCQRPSRQAQSIRISTMCSG
jgi:hypothetical protein